MIDIDQCTWSASLRTVDADGSETLSKDGLDFRLVAPTHPPLAVVLLKRFGVGGSSQDSSGELGAWGMEEIITPASKYVYGAKTLARGEFFGRISGIRAVHRRICS